MREEAEEIFREDRGGKPFADAESQFIQPFFHKRPFLSGVIADDRIYNIGVDLLGPDFLLHGTEGRLRVGPTPWHAGRVQPNSVRHIKVGMYLDTLRKDTGCLRVIPGSHRDGVRGAPFADEELDRAISLPTAPGDIIVLHNKLLHSSTLNTSEKDFRWAFNFRYLPTGEPSGRPFLPGFIVRSRSAPDTEFKNPYLWATMWQKALDHLSKNGSPYAYTDLREGKLDLNFARNLTKSWNTRVPNPQDWLSLEG